ncbi:MAG: response regulator, partial [Proteobacteria bacterium]|nr:response regulator [Pseudomonadota bacterium]
EHYEYSQLVLTESKVLLELINSLLDHAKIASGKFELEMRPFHLKCLLEDLNTLMAVRAEQKELKYECQISARTPNGVVGDPARLSQILHNLLSNALKFTEKGRISVKVDVMHETDDDITLRFSVEDTGIGIPKSKQAQIFESFTQADSSITHRFGGTGLGTTISKELTELMGGEIGLRSESGQGSTFWFTALFRKIDNPQIIDLLSSEHKKEKHSDDTKHWDGHVLLVEDYKTNQLVAMRYLENVGCRVELAENGQQAVELFNRGQYDLILMDVNMPVMDGFAASRLIRDQEQSTGARIPIIALTANAFAEDREKCFAAGMDDFLEKPLQRKKLYAKLEKWLEDTDDSASASEFPPESVDTRESIPEATSLPMQMDKAVDMFAGDEKTMRETAAVFLESVAQQMTTVKHALENQDTETIRMEAHSIKGGALTLAAGALVDAALKLEKKAEVGDLSSAQALIKEILNQKQQLEHFLKTV